MNSKAVQRGAVAESSVCTWALKQGYLVLFPARGLAPHYDLAIDNGVSISKVQVKRAHVRYDRRTPQLRANLTDGDGSTYDSVDAVAIVDVDTDRIWLIPMMFIRGQKTIGLQSGRYDAWLVQCGQTDYPS
jgi:hypothetical protein